MKTLRGKQSAARIFYIENFGCAKNQVDGEALAAVLLDSGWRITNAPEEAALIIVNTCGFILPAKKESLAAVMDFRKRFPRAKIIAAGCLSERYGNELALSLSEADGVFGNRDLSRMSGFAENIVRGAAVKTRSAKIPSGAGRVLLPAEYGKLPRRKKVFSPAGCVYIKAAEGCGNRCAFCAIPIIRGDLRSRNPGDIAAEVKAFLDGGVFEFNIVAQDLGAYGRDIGTDLISFIGSILDIQGDFRLRLLYIHPEHFPRGLLTLCRNDPRLLPYFDLPFQHASSVVLKAMGRQHGREENLELLAEIREAVPDAVIRSTFLVGFPGETDKDFEALLDFQKKAAFDWLGAFPYSAEEDTPAYALHKKKELRVPVKTAKERKKLIEETQIPITEKRLDRFVGRETVLLVEEPVQGEELSLARAWFQAPEVDGLTVLCRAAVPGEKIRARILRRNGFDMEAVSV